MPTASLRKPLSRMKHKALRAKYKLQGRELVHFLHIGKTGGMAVKHALRPHVTAGRFAIFLHPHGVTLKDVPAGEGVFFFLRDPLKRFVSGFYSRQRQGRPRVFTPWTPDEKTTFAHFDTPNQLALALSATDPAEKARADHAMSSIGHVKNSYWEWFADEDYFRSRWKDVLLVGFQESLADDFLALRDKLGLPPSITLPTDDVKAHRNPVSVDKKLDDAAIANLQRWYAEDSRFIELCRELQGAASSDSS